MALLSSMQSRIDTLQQQTSVYKKKLAEQAMQSRTDPLTRLPNRQAYNERLETAYTRFKSNGHSLAVAVVDIDHFKSYNDSLGHVAGDACLVAVAETLERSVRPDKDLVARLGGEEFAVVLVDVSAAAAAEQAEAIRANVQALQASGAERVRRQVTVSIGLSTRDANQQKPLSVLMEEADAAVYRAKATGRNRVCLHDSSRPRNVA